MSPDSVPPFDPAAIRAILLDIEGTTTPVEFVTGVLFPFARAHMRGFLEAHAAEPEIRAEIEALRREHGADSAKPEAPQPWGDSSAYQVEAAAGYALWLMDRDRKSTPLKSLQGRIWEAGYRSGELRGQVYPDVPPALARWKQQGRVIAIFSSGSVQAQKLLFRHSEAGDLTRYIDAYFDTTTGPKQQPQSYRRIADALATLDKATSNVGREEQRGALAPSSLPQADAEREGVKHQFGPECILFISDVPAELDAARAAGMHTLLAVRSSAKPPCEASHRAIHSFEVVLP